jgi:AcrR family transcriptional regulator
MRSDAVANRTALVEAARRLFSTRGVDVALATVAEEAGTGIATLYRHFPTRSDLAQAVVLDFAERFVAIEEAYSDDFEADPERAWNAFVHELADLRPGALLPAVVDLFAAEGVPAYAAQTVQRVNESQGRLVERAHAAGLVRDDINAVDFQVGLATVTRPLTEAPGHACAGADGWLVELYIRGLRPDPRPPA